MQACSSSSSSNSATRQEAAASQVTKYNVLQAAPNKQHQQHL
jgi:hypothetical protein